MKANDLKFGLPPVRISAPALTFVGDFVSPSWRPARLSGFLSAIGDSALAINLEGPLLVDEAGATPRLPVKHNIASSRSAVSALPSDRTIFCVANNHFEDFGRQHRVDIEKAGLIEAGSRAVPAVQAMIGGQSIVVAPLSLPSPDPARWRRASDSVTLSPSEALKHLARIRKASGNAKLVAYVHWGYEHQHIPFPADRAWARQAFDAGVDIIIGNHAHILQPVEIIAGRLVAFSLGNFYFPNGTYFGQQCIFPEHSRKSAAIRVTGSQTEISLLESQDMDGEVNILSTTTLDRSPLIAEFSGLSDNQYARYFRDQKARGQAPMPVGMPVIDDYQAAGGNIARAFFAWQDVRQTLRNSLYKLRDAGRRPVGRGSPPLLRNRPRVLITHQGCVPIYRKPLFDRLARISDIEYVVAYGKPPRGTGYLVAEPPYDFKSLEIASYELGIGSTTLIWQPLVAPFWRDFDAVILGDEIKYVSHLALIAAARLRRRPVLFWGFGYPSGDKDMPALGLGDKIERAAKSAFRKTVLHAVDGYLAYTASGRDAVVAAGIPLDHATTISNTVDIEFQTSLRQRALQLSESHCRKTLGLADQGAVLLYFGRFRRAKHVDLLIAYAKRCQKSGRPLSVVLSGLGETKDDLVAQAAGLTGVSFHLLTDLDLAIALRVATAVVVPGYAGLAIPHAFAHGVPFLTREGIVHPPEIDYLVPGENGLMLPHDETAFFDALDRYLDDTPLQQRLRRGALEAASKLSMDAMAAEFDGLVRRLLVERGRLPNHLTAAPATSTAPNGAA